MKKPALPNQHGFTLIELCVAMALVIMAGYFTIPQLARLQERWTMQTVTQTVLTTLNAARIEALKRNKVIAVCGSVNNRECASFDAASRHWLIVDESDGTVLRSTAIAGNYSIRGSPTRPRVRFQPSGWSSGSNMSLKVCDPQGQWVKDVIISNAGRIRSQPHSEQARC